MRRGRRPLPWIVTAGVAVLLVAVVALVVRPDDAAVRPGASSHPASHAATTAPSPRPSPSPSPVRLRAEVRAPHATTVLAATDPVTAAVEASAAVFATAPVVVLAPAHDEAAGLTGASAAVVLGSPLLLTPGPTPPDEPDPESTPEPTSQPTSERTPQPTPEQSQVADELARLAPSWVVAVGDAVVPAAHGAHVVAVAPGADAEELSEVLGERLPPTARPAAVDGLVALAGAGGDTPAALATLRAARIPVVAVPGGDPRASTATVEAVAAAAPVHVVALGSAFGPADRLDRRIAAAATGVLAPGGGQLVFPDVDGVPHKRYVALYGTPGSSALGLLGEQDVPATIARAQKTARQFRPWTDASVVPAVEIIATIASGGPEKDGSYSRRRSVADLRPLVDAAHDAGLAVVLDLQPGRDDFLSQAKEYAELLELPNVGLALDPEWRLGPDQVHLEQIGSVDVAEINAVGDWLAALTAEHHLPQKLFVLHQFSLRMIHDREGLDTSHDELATLIHVDGQGTQPAKRGTWNTLRAGAPPVHWGWKNFVDEDSPMLTPEQTMAIDPVPDLVTYQ